MVRIINKVILSTIHLPKPKPIWDRTTLKSLFLFLVMLCVATFLVNRLQTWFSKKIIRDSFARQLLYVLLSLAMGTVIFGITFFIMATFVEKASLRTVINGSIIYSIMHSLMFIIKDEAPELIKITDDDDLL